MSRDRIPQFWRLRALFTCFCVRRDLRMYPDDCKPTYSQLLWPGRKAA